MYLNSSILAIKTTEIKSYNVDRKEKIMGTLLGLALLFCVFVLPGIITNAKFDNRLPPAGYRVDHGAINRDFAMGKSKMEVMRKCNNGGYDVPV